MGLLTAIAAPVGMSAEPAPAAAAAFDRYAASVESRLARQHQSQNGFIAALPDAPSRMRLRQGEVVVERITPVADANPPGAMLHHWRGTAFVPGANAGDFERLMKDFNAYPQRFSPQVLTAKVLWRQGDHLLATMRVRQQHILTVVMDTTYDVNFARLDPQHGFSISRSTRIAEISSPGTPSERALTAGEEHGFLWRLNTYWSFEERDGGLYLQVESISLTRSIPHGMGLGRGTVCGKRAARVAAIYFAFGVQRAEEMTETIRSKRQKRRRQ